MFLSKSTSAAVHAVFFIRSASIDAYLVSAEGIAYRTHAELPYQKELDFDRYRKSMLAALMECSMKLSSEGIASWGAANGHRGLASVECILSAPWHQPLIETIELSADTPFEITEKVLKSATEAKIKEQSGALAEALGGEIAIIAKKLSRFWINGYPTKEPYGLLGSTVAVQVQCAAIGTDVRASISEVLEKVLNQETITLDTSMGLLSRTMPALDDEGRFTIIEVHGEITEITIIEDGGIAGRATVPAGTHSLVRMLQKYTTMTPSEAESAIIMQEKRKASKSEETKAITEARDAWCKGVANALSELANNGPAPSAIAVAADPGWLSWCTDAVAASSAIASEIGVHPKLHRVSDELAKTEPAQKSDHADYAAQLALISVDSARSAKN